ncbi:MAG: lipoate--protein ligase family protein [Phycisphaerae bacterium]
MARDELLMQRANEPSYVPTLRLYEWEPTISLGYFQRFEDVQHQDQSVAELPVVRRLTGGGAILHDFELTYSIILPVDHPLVAGKPNQLYELAHDAIIRFLEKEGMAAHRNGETDDSGAAKGPFFCFARRHALDVLIGDDKIAGSAQRRTRTALLQHGSLILGRRFTAQPSAEINQPHEALVAIARRVFPDLLAEQLGLDAYEENWHASELLAVQPFEEKYAGDDWTRRT